MTAGLSDFRAQARDWLRAHVPPEPLPSVDTAERVVSSLLPSPPGASTAAPFTSAPFAGVRPPDAGPGEVPWA